MTIYEKIKNMSVDEMTEFLVDFCVISSCYLIFRFEADKDFVKSLPNYNDFCDKAKEMLMGDE